MSGGKARASGGANSRVSLPTNVKDMIETIKEIAGGYNDEEIHAKLKECAMDQNDAAQKLLSQEGDETRKRTPSRCRLPPPKGEEGERRTEVVLFKSIHSFTPWQIGLPYSSASYSSSSFHLAFYSSYQGTTAASISEV